MDTNNKLLCENCIYRRDDIKSGILCELTGMKPDYIEDCRNFIEGPSSRVKRIYKQPLSKNEIRSLKEIVNCLKGEFPDISITQSEDTH